MAARNSDSKRIFDYYVNRLLSEQETESDETSSDSQKPKQTETAATDQSPKTSTPYMPKPGTQSGPGMQGGDARREQYVDAYGGGKPVKTWNQQNAASYPPGPLANPTPEQKAQMQGSGGEKVAPSTAPKTADDKEKGLLKQLHASDFNPNSTTDQKRLEELRTAQTKLKEKLGREPSLKELATVSYAQQYGEKSPYYAQAQKMGIDFGKPGQPTGGATPPSTQQAQATNVSTAESKPVAGVNVPNWANYATNKEQMPQFQTGNTDQGPTISSANPQRAQALASKLKELGIPANQNQIDSILQALNQVS